MKQELMKPLRKDLEDTAARLGGRFFGVADLTGVTETIVEQGGDYLSVYPRGLTIGVVLADGVVHQLPRHREIAVARTYDYL